MELPEIDLARLRERFDRLWAEATDIWSSGGWAMIAIAVIAFFLFAIGMHLYLGLRAKKFRSVSEKRWRRWIDHPDERKGPIGGLLDFVDGSRSLKEGVLAFDQLRMTETASFERDLRVMKICVSAAPLVGLLGTVTGMLATFSALSSGSGGDKTMELVAGGISEALITTETGLIVALPGLFFQYQMSRTYERYKAFLAHLESVYTQKLYRRIQAEGGAPTPCASGGRDSRPRERSEDRAGAAAERVPASASLQTS